jgi:5-methylcytosine-specific restriction enzyme subunit McrC
VATWTVYEFARLYRDTHTQFDGGDLRLSAKQFDSLKKLMTSSESDHDKLFRYGFERRTEVLVCQNYVGVICLPDGDQIEILPKTHRHSVGENEYEQLAKADNRKNLVKMLMSTRHLPNKSASAASLDIERMPLLDVFIQLFLNQVSLLIKRGVAHHYQTKEENIPFLKGKLLVSQQVRHNLVIKHRHFMAYDELSANRAENRLICSALHWALKRVQGQTQHLCQELLTHFNSIPRSKNITLDMQQWQKARHLSHYQPIRPWLEMIFKEHSPTSVDGSKEMLSLLFPMERVFEDYVAIQLRKQFPDYKIRTKVREHSLLTHTPLVTGIEKKLFQLEPDLHIEAEGRVIIADTKWKLINENLPNKKYKVSESDIYQMLAYNQTYQKDQEEAAEIWLIYPRTEKFRNRIPDFMFDNGTVIKVLPFDVDESFLLGIGEEESVVLI